MRFIELFKQLVTTNNYDSLTDLTHSKDHCNYSTHKVFSVFSSRCLVAAFNGERSPSSGFPNCPHLQLQFPTSHNCNSRPTQQQLAGKLLLAFGSTVILCSEFHGTHDLILLTVLTVTAAAATTTTTELLVLILQPRHGPHRKRLFHYCVFSQHRENVSTELFPSNSCCTVACLRSCYLTVCYVKRSEETNTCYL
jgi:hypothetical protein